MKLHSIRFKAMGSPCELQLYLQDSQASALGQGAQDEIMRLERKYSRYLSDSVTSRINASAGSGRAIEVDEETAGLLDYADIIYQQSEGLFDISSGILRRAWNFKSNQLPSQTQIDQLLPLVGWRKLDWQRPLLLLPETGMELDFGGLVKEYAADAAANYCLERGIEHGLINLGGDIRVIGPHPDASPWRLGIRHPRALKTAMNGAIAEVHLSHGALATSGDYERFMLINNQRYCHLLDPHTGWSIQPAFASASVIAPQCLLAGSFSTVALLKSTTEPEWLSQSGLPYLLVDQALQLSGSINYQPTTFSSGEHNVVNSF
jgi:FAD:protein FMN transferase